ncbi:class I SAM-dependent methyltransferase [Thermodesulfovibrionales bacterium]|nr:class I SAM-dependent methyltransferase [Thermodesulfovibrionales bacterium]
MKDFFISKKLKSNYDEYYKGESKWREVGAIDKVKNIIDLCWAIPHEKVLDIGSGEGAVLKKLSDIKFAKELYSIEISVSSVEVIKKRKIPNLIECKLFDGYHIPYKNEEFDLVILSHIIEHVEYPRALLKEAGRVARHIFIEVPLELNARLPLNYKWSTVGHINFYSPKTLRYFLSTTNFKIINQKIRNSSYAVYKYQFGNKAIFRYFLKESILLCWPRLATKLFTYNCAILAFLSKERR